ncbi:MAG: hypothetical protein AB7H88_21780 [Vicinamibacterales bacterium]
MRHSLLIGLLIAASSAALLQGQSPAYTFVDLGLPGTATVAFAQGVNNANQVVVTTVGSAWRWEAGAYTDLGVSTLVVTDAFIAEDGTALARWPDHPAADRHGRALLLDTRRRLRRALRGARVHERASRGGRAEARLAVLRDR